MPVWLTALLLALFTGTLVEYWGHRMMHAWLLKKKHAEHHKEGSAQGWFWEFLDYLVGTVYILPLGFFYSWEAGWGFLGGAILYATFAAYSHQLQHEKPEMCFWLARPVHHIHHHQKMWKHNFGISLDLWDHVFGTYKKVDWTPSRRLRDCSVREFFHIKWV